MYPVISHLSVSVQYKYPMISAKAVSYMEAYRSGHNEAVVKICEHNGRKNAEKPCKHWLFEHSESNRKQHF